MRNPYLPKKHHKGIILFFVLMTLFLLIWGFIGGQEAKDVGITCDMGVKDDTLCWKWHKNIIGQGQEALENLGDKIKELIE